MQILTHRVTEKVRGFKNCLILRDVIFELSLKFFFDMFKIFIYIKPFHDPGSFLETRDIKWVVIQEWLLLKISI